MLSPSAMAALVGLIVFYAGLPLWREGGRSLRWMMLGVALLGTDGCWSLLHGKLNVWPFPEPRVIYLLPATPAPSVIDRT